MGTDIFNNNFSTISINNRDLVSAKRCILLSYVYLCGCLHYRVIIKLDNISIIWRKTFN